MKRYKKEKDCRKMITGSEGRIRAEKKKSFFARGERANNPKKRESFFLVGKRKEHPRKKDAGYKSKAEEGAKESAPEKPQKKGGGGTTRKKVPRAKKNLNVVIGPGIKSND